MQVLESQGLSQTTGEAILSVRQVSKRFCRGLKRSLWYGVEDIVSEVAGRDRGEGLRPQEFWALKDVSLEVRRGEAVGLVGANGAGKTTLLRIISGLIKPDAGSVAVRGRVAPLIALGAGFNPILTGRENIFANMAILGLSRREIEERFERVIEFAEIGEAIDAPVQSYSSGMAARLGFASAIFTEPDILLVDEVLAVGDAQFQAKCTRKLAELRENKVSFIMVSHSSSTLLSCCQSAVYIKKGEIQKVGNSKDVIDFYEQDLFSIDQNTLGKVQYAKKIVTRKENLDLNILYIFFRDEDEKILNEVRTGQNISLCIACETHRELADLIPFISIYDLEGRSNLVDNTILQIGSNYDSVTLHSSGGFFEIRLNFHPLLLAPGKYVANIGIHKGMIPNGLDVCPDFFFKVSTSNITLPLDRNIFFQPRTWSTQKIDTRELLAVDSRVNERIK